MLMNAFFIAFLLIQMCSLLDGLELGASCTNNEDCSVENSRCHFGRCSCLPYYANYNSTLCLQSTLLGFECHVPEQCSQKVANSTCIQGMCQCDKGFLQFRRHTCLTPAKVGAICYSDTHCRLWDSDTHCNFLIQNLFGKCVCNSPMRQSQARACTPGLPIETAATEQVTAMMKPEALVASTEGADDSVMDSTTLSSGKEKKPVKPNTSIFTNRSPIKFPPSSNSKPGKPDQKKPSNSSTVVQNSAFKRPAQNQRPRPQPTFSSYQMSQSTVTKPPEDFKQKVTQYPTPSSTPSKDVFQEKISTDLEPPNSSQSTLKPFKTTITLVEKTKPGVKPSKPNKYTAVFLTPTVSSLPALTTNFPKFTILQDVATTAGTPGKLTTWIINDVSGVLNTPTAPTRFKPTVETSPTKNSFTKYHLKRPVDQFSNFINSGLSASSKPAQYSTIKLNALNTTLDQMSFNRFGPQKNNLNHVSLTTAASSLTHSKRTTPAPFLRTTTRLPLTGALVSVVKDQSSKTTPKTPGFIKQSTRLPGLAYPTEQANSNPFLNPFKLKNQSKPTFGVTLVKPTHETPTTSTWVRPITPGSSNIITKIIASPGPAVLYTMGAKVGPEKDPIKVSLGMPCKNHKQCIRADPESRCMSGICDCVKPRNNATGAYCNAFNRGCHLNTFQCKSSGKCISWFFVCDGRRDCPDGSDEACNGRNGCPHMGFRCGKLEPAVCISQAARCDGAWDCPGGEDEANCTASAHQDCPAHTYKCSSGHCVPEYEYCNAAAACKDGSDELAHACSANWDSDVTTLGFCPFRCNNGRCRSSAVTCSGKDGCGDDSDEAKCNVCKCARIS